MKKAIRFFLNLLSPFLKVLIVPESMTLCGSSFHLSVKCLILVRRQRLKLTVVTHCKANAI